MLKVTFFSTFKFYAEMLHTDFISGISTCRLNKIVVWLTIDKRMFGTTHCLKANKKSPGGYVRYEYIWFVIGSEHTLIILVVSCCCCSSSCCCCCYLEQWTRVLIYGFVSFLLNHCIFLWLRNKTSVPVFYRRIKTRYELGVWIKARVRYNTHRTSTDILLFYYKTARPIVPL